MTGTEQVLIDDWCQQYPSHSVGDLVVRRGRRALRQRRRRRELQLRRLRPGRRRRQPVRRPARRRGRRMTPPTAEGGALRARTCAPPATRSALDGTVIRVDPDTGAALAGQPAGRRRATPTRAASSRTACATRSAWRSRPGTDESGSATSAGHRREEINRIDPADRGVGNFGWPCYEGDAAAAGYDSATSASARTCTPKPAPYRAVFATATAQPVVPGETLHHRERRRSGRASRSTPGGAYPAEYDGALFFADYARNCIWVMTRGRRRRCPTRPGASRSVRGRAGPGTWSSAPAATSSTPTSTAARSGASSGRAPGRGTSRPGSTGPSTSPNTDAYRQPRRRRPARRRRSNHAVGNGSSARASARTTSPPAGPARSLRRPQHVPHRVGRRRDPGVGRRACPCSTVRGQSPTTFTASRALTAGAHQVRVEWYVGARPPSPG